MTDKTGKVFGNKMKASTLRKASKNKAKYLAKFGDDSSRQLGIRIVETPVLGPLWGMKSIEVGLMKDGMQSTLQFPAGEKPLIIGTIRMGYGHFRISMAIASAARHLGFTPYWFDMHSFEETSAGKIIRHLNNLYSLGSRLSQKIPLFNALYWEPLNAEGFRKLEYNAVDQKASELMAPVCELLPKDVPFVATHVWPAQAAVHAGLKKVVNVIPDNWPMALHLAEGSIHTVQTPSAFLGYRMLNGMLEKSSPIPMPSGSVYDTGHYMDHEFMLNIDADCNARIARRSSGAPLRILISIGGAGAQKDYILTMLDNLRAELASGKIAFWINTGDHSGVRDAMIAGMQERGLTVSLHESWQESGAFDPNSPGHHLFCHQGIFEAVYMTNKLIPASDLLITKPSELAFYPVPKLLIKRIGGHEAWGAIRSAEIGDGSQEITDPRRAAEYLSVMIKDRDILETMNNNIKKAANAGTYNGAYRVVELATKGAFNA